MSASDSLGKEFREIGNCGGKLELIRNEEGISMSISGKGFTGYVQVGISLDGERTSRQRIASGRSGRC